MLRLIEAAVAAGIPLVQIREKNLTARMLFELTTRAAQLTAGTKTKLLVNDRADIAGSAGADGVHLTSQSLRADVVRSSFGSDFLIGVSTHSLAEARAARDAGGDFVVFGPVFETESKRAFGAPQGLEKLREVAADLEPFPVIAIGGISLENVGECVRTGASGIAAIRLFQDPKELSGILDSLRY